MHRWPLISCEKFVARGAKQRKQKVIRFINSRQKPADSPVAKAADDPVKINRSDDIIKGQAPLFNAGIARGYLDSLVGAIQRP